MMGKFISESGVTAGGLLCDDHSILVSHVGDLIVDNGGGSRAPSRKPWATTAPHNAPSVAIVTGSG